MLTITRIHRCPGSGTDLAAVPTQAATPTKLPPGSIKHQNSQWWAGSRRAVGRRSTVRTASASRRATSGSSWTTEPVRCSAPRGLRGSLGERTLRRAAADVRRTLRQSWRRVRIGQSQIRQLPESGCGPFTSGSGSRCPAAPTWTPLRRRGSSSTTRWPTARSTASPANRREWLRRRDCGSHCANCGRCRRRSPTSRRACPSKPPSSAGLTVVVPTVSGAGSTAARWPRTRRSPRRIAPACVSTGGCRRG